MNEEYLGIAEGIYMLLLCGEIREVGKLKDCKLGRSAADVRRSAKLTILENVLTAMELF
jgi:hypothetical protein